MCLESVAHLLVMFNCSTNFLVYWSVSQQFKAALSRVCRCFCGEQGRTTGKRQKFVLPRNYINGGGNKYWFVLLFPPRMRVWWITCSTACKEVRPVSTDKIIDISCSFWLILFSGIIDRSIWEILLWDSRLTYDWILESQPVLNVEQAGNKVTPNTALQMEEILVVNGQEATSC